MRRLYYALLIVCLLSGLSAGCRGRQATVKHELKRSWLEYAVLAVNQITLWAHCGALAGERVRELRLKMVHAEYLLSTAKNYKNMMLRHIRILKLPATNPRVIKRLQQWDQKIAQRTKRLKSLRRELERRKLLEKKNKARCLPLRREGDDHFNAVKKRTERYQ